MNEKCNLVFDVGGTLIKYALISPEYKIVKRGVFQTVYDGMDSLLAVFVEIGKRWSGQYSGVGVCLPGAVLDDGKGTVCRGGSLTYMSGVPLQEKLEQIFHLPCAVENDGKAGALGEYAQGVLRGCQCGVFLGIGTAIAGGIVMEGKIWKGSHCFAAEFSYLLSNVYSFQNEGVSALLGFKCGTGKMIDMLKEKQGRAFSEEMTGYELFDLANKGDENAIQSIRETVKPLVMHIYNLQSILDVDRFAIGGGISKNILLLQIIREELDKIYNLIPKGLMPPKAEIYLSKHGNDANLIGVASLIRK